MYTLCLALSQLMTDLTAVLLFDLIKISSNHRVYILIASANCPGARSIYNRSLWAPQQLSTMSRFKFVQGKDHRYCSKPPYSRWHHWYKEVNSSIYMPMMSPRVKNLVIGGVYLAQIWILTLLMIVVALPSSTYFDIHRGSVVRACWLVMCTAHT